MNLNLEQWFGVFSIVEIFLREMIYGLSFNKNFWKIIKKYSTGDTGMIQSFFAINEKITRGKKEYSIRSRYLNYITFGFECVGVPASLLMTVFGGSVLIGKYLTYSNIIPTIVGIVAIMGSFTAMGLFFYWINHKDEKIPLYRRGVLDHLEYFFKVKFTSLVFGIILIVIPIIYPIK